MQYGEGFRFGSKSIDLIFDEIYPAKDILLCGFSIDGNVLALLSPIPPINDSPLLDNPQPLGG